MRRYEYTLSPEASEQILNAGGFGAGDQEYLTVVADANGVNWLSAKYSEAPDHPEWKNAAGKPLKVLRVMENCRVVEKKLRVTLMEIVIDPDENPPFTRRT